MSHFEAGGAVAAPGAASAVPLDGDEAAIRRWVGDFQEGRDREVSFRRIFERFHRPVESFFGRRGVTVEDCLDLTQEVFLNVYRGLDGWQPEARFGTWVFRIATTVFLKYHRSRSTAKRKGQEVSPDSVAAAIQWTTAPEQLDEVLVEERRRAVEGAMEELPERMRHCLLLRVDQGLKYREIAGLMQVSIQTVKAHLFQARGRLAHRLEASFSGKEAGG